MSNFLRKVTHVIVHCSDSAWGDLAEINRWHKARGFDGPGGIFVGYHYLILNGFPTYGGLKDHKRLEAEDGLIVQARSERWWGCHALGYNDRSIGICLVGVADFTPRQMRAAVGLVNSLRRVHGVPVDNVLGHCETALAGGKSCPNINMHRFRELLSEDATEEAHGTGDGRAEGGKAGEGAGGGHEPHG